MPDGGRGVDLGSQVPCGLGRQPGGPLLSGSSPTRRRHPHLGTLSGSEVDQAGLLGEGSGWLRLGTGELQTWYLTSPGGLPACRWPVLLWLMLARASRLSPALVARMGQLGSGL